MTVFSKIAVYTTGTIPTTCVEYVHPWTNSCLQAACGLSLYAAFYSLKLYGLNYMMTLFMKGQIPTKDDLWKKFLGVLQSTAFLSATLLGSFLFTCFLRRLLGHFNILTVSALPVFLSSVFSILIERPSRRTLICLYVNNVATETLWNMALSRNMVKNIKYGDTAIFAVSMAVLLMYYKGGFHKSSDSKADLMFGVLRFVVGSYEEKDYSVQEQVQDVPDAESSPKSSENWNKNSRRKNLIFHVINQALCVYKKMIYKIKCCDRHLACPHPFSCLYYTMQGFGKMFSVGLGIQVALKLVLNLKKIFQSPKHLNNILIKKDTLNLAIFLGGFSGLFRAVLCVLRRTTGKDNFKFAIPASLIAGVAFNRYPSSTLALYIMWKAAQVTYNIGINKSFVPRVPGFTEFLYCFSTAVLFHAAALEPNNLRPSYWKFLHSISGGRITCVNRIPLDVWGLASTESLKKVLESTKTQPIVRTVFGI